MALKSEKMLVVRKNQYMNTKPPACVHLKTPMYKVVRTAVSVLASMLPPRVVRQEIKRKVVSWVSMYIPQQMVTPLTLLLSW